MGDDNLGVMFIRQATRLFPKSLWENEAKFNGFYNTIKDTVDIMEPWRKVAPTSEGGGVFLNEADVQEPNWQADFYGASNYAKLLAIKRKWDPRDVFYATIAVGSEA
jgi:hypothetical protein